MQSKYQTLGEFIIENQNEFEYSTGELSRLINAIRLAAKVVNHKVNQAGLVDLIGGDGSQNSSGESQQKLDVFANETFINALTNREIICGIVSEEEDDFIAITHADKKNQNKYIVLIDPLDGSSNIDVNVSIGTVFSIYRRKTAAGTPVILDDFLQKGSEQVAAGYIVYGTSTMLVYTTGHGVNGFTLDPSIGEFCLSHSDMKIPASGNYYSVNQGYYLKFDLEMRRYIDHCSDLNLRLRYIGSMVSDIHRILFQGGIFLYPNTRKYPHGKLRLLYECNPMAMIVEQAGGKAITCCLERILAVPVTNIHQKVTIAIGSPDMVDEMKKFVERYSAVNA